MGITICFSLIVPVNMWFDSFTSWERVDTALYGFPIGNVWIFALKDKTKKNFKKILRSTTK